uniref:Prephenate dehydrogenase n=1 Tax=Streptomyces lavendulae TaxID=1914 RepID=B0CN33_STRLA|nr:prephenate dehydrogenase [Streptomyces lavendulae]
MTSIGNTEDAGSLISVTVIGTGLIGTSIGLALTEYGVRVHLQDVHAESVRIAEARGAGTALAPERQTDLAVIAVPPQSVRTALADAQRRRIARHYTDVASVKAALPAAGADLGWDASRFIGGHPIAGREHPGPGAARSDMFRAKPWILTPSADTSQETIATARRLIGLCGADVVTMQPEAHDRAVAMTSHLPHLVSSLMARLLRSYDHRALELSGSGLRDFTRIAAGDPDLWTDILGSNATAVLGALENLQHDLEMTRRILHALAASPGAAEAAEAPAYRELLRRLLEEGRAGQLLIPQKYGAAGRAYDKLQVLLTDREGELARLLADVSELNVNVEDLWIEDSADSPVGLAVLSVDAGMASMLSDWLAERGWPVLGESMSADPVAGRV